MTSPEESNNQGETDKDPDETKVANPLNEKTFKSK